MAEIAAVQVARNADRHLLEFGGGPSGEQCFGVREPERQPATEVLRVTPGIAMCLPKTLPLKLRVPNTTVLQNSTHPGQVRLPAFGEHGIEGRPQQAVGADIVVEPVHEQDDRLTIGGSVWCVSLAVFTGDLFDVRIMHVLAHQHAATLHG
jgi:hypothetical protein